MTSPSNNFARPLDYSAGPRADRGDSSRGLHFLALLTAVATFPLIFMGGLVTSHHAGMSVPDWPNSYGYNMFLFPPNQWVGGILYEHTHRLMASVVGMLSIALVVWAWRAQLLAMVRNVARCLPIASLSRPVCTTLDRWNPPIERHRYLALAVLGAVIFQGVLGGLRVVLVKLDLAIIHACVAQAFFCLAALMALVTSRGWERTPALERSNNRGLVALGVVTVLVIFAQLMVGATMRHFDAGLAIPDLPLAYGKLLPPTSAEALARVNHFRAFQLNLDPVTLTQVWLHFGHRIGAIAVSVLVISLAVVSIRRRGAVGLAVPAIILLVLLAGQLTLGVITVLLRKPADVASLHVAVGALVLMTSFVLAARAARLYRLIKTELPVRAPQPQSFTDSNSAAGRRPSGGGSSAEVALGGASRVAPPASYASLTQTGSPKLRRA